MKPFKFDLKYPDLFSVKAYNDFLDLLTEPTASEEQIELVMGLLSVGRPSDDLNKFVVGSVKHTEISAKINMYNAAKEQLDNLFVTSELMCEIRGFESLSRIGEYIIKYSFWVEETHELSCWISDDEKDYWEETLMCEKTFYVLSCFDAFPCWRVPLVIKSREELYHPYFDEDGRNDLVQNALDHIVRVNNELTCLKCCVYHDISYADVESVFGHGFTMNYQYLECLSEQYYYSQVKSLIAEYKAAKDKPWIYNDEYVEYPRNLSYIQFLNEQYKEVVQTS